MKIFCSYQKLVPIQDLSPHPRNRNRHPTTQIELLARILKERGWRHPIIVSNLSGVVVAGHCRLEAAKLAGFTEVPVDYQDFETKEQEYEFLVADNATSLWAELDLSGIGFDLETFGPAFNIDLLGLRDFKIDVAELPDLPDGDKPPFQQKTFTLTDEQANHVENALEIARGLGAYGDTGNENSNGNALARVCELFAGAHGNS